MRCPFVVFDISPRFLNNLSVALISNWLYFVSVQNALVTLAPFGRSVLIVEDEPLIALDLHDTLHKAGASIIAATTIKEALELIARAQICAAIVDVKVGGQDCSSVCDALAKRSIPFMFYTGYYAPSLSQWPAAPAVGKPAAGSILVDAIVQLVPLER